MQPISDRLDSVRQFTSDIQPSLQYNIVPITDPFGPAVTDSQLDCIVVTTETVLGADRINVKRVEQVWYYHQKTHILCITHCWSLKYIRVSCLFRNVWTDSLPALSANWLLFIYDAVFHCITVQTCQGWQSKTRENSAESMGWGSWEGQRASQLGGHSGERCKLPSGVWARWNQIWCILVLKSDIWWQKL